MGAYLSFTSFVVAPTLYFCNHNEPASCKDSTKIFVERRKYEEHLYHLSRAFQINVAKFVHLGMNEGQSLLSKHTKTKKNEILGVPVTKTGENAMRDFCIAFFLLFEKHLCHPLPYKIDCHDKRKSCVADKSDERTDT